MKRQHVQSLWLGITCIARQPHQAPAGGSGVGAPSMILRSGGPMVQLEQVAQGSVWVHRAVPGVRDPQLLRVVSQECFSRGLFIHQ